MRRLVAEHLDLTLLAALFIVAVAPRLALQLGAPIFAYSDSAGYLELAQKLVEGLNKESGTKRPVGYPLLLAASFTALGFRLDTVSAVQHSLGVLSVGLTYLLGRECFNRWVGFGAGLLLALSGPQLVLEHTPLAEPPFIPLLLGFALALIRATRVKGYGPVLLAGVLLGLATLMKPVGQSLLPLALLFAAVRPGTGRERLVSIMTLVAAFAVVVAPWVWRNAATHGQLTIGGALGDSLLAHTLRYARGRFVFDSPALPPEPNPTLRAARRILQAGVDRGEKELVVRDRVRAELRLDNYETDRLIQRLTLEAIKRQPLTFLANIPEFLGRSYEYQRVPASLWDSAQEWEDHPRIGVLARSTPVKEETAKPQLLALINSYQPSRLGLVLPLLALLGLAVTWHASGGRLLAPAMVAGSLAIVLLLVHVALNGPVDRYRYIVEPFLNVLALGGIWTMISHGYRAVRRIERPTDATAAGRPARYKRAFVCAAEGHPRIQHAEPD